MLPIKESTDSHYEIGVLISVATCAFYEDILKHGATNLSKEAKLGSPNAMSPAEKLDLKDVLSDSVTTGCHAPMLETPDAPVKIKLGKGNET